MRAVLIALSLAFPAYAQAPEPAYSLDCGTLSGRGAVILVIDGKGYRVVIECGQAV